MPDRRATDTADRPAQPPGKAQRSGADTHRVIKGRRWRISDPSLDESTRQHLVDELMDARRAVKAALAQANPKTESIARRRVDDAKVALGERGPKWWEPMTPDDVDRRVDAFIRAIGTRLDDIDEERANTLLQLSP